MTINQALISATTLSTSAASVTIAVPSGYTDLRLVISARLLSSGNVGGSIQMNGVNSNAPLTLLATGSGVSSEVNNLTGLHNSSSYTANTFSNAEIYIPNYLSNTNKYYSYDGTTENNATASYMGMSAGVVPTTSPVTSITIVAAGDYYVTGSSFTLYGISKLGVTPTVFPKATGGDIIKNDGTYWYHAFLSTGAFIPQTTLSADVLVVAGGGGSGTYGGGGGAGGLLGFTSQSLSATSYVCTIGAGGAGATGSPLTATARGSNGNNSQFGSLTASIGGGGGGGDGNQDGSTYIYRNGANGGSGGGGGPSDQGYGTSVGGSATSGQGYAGGNGSGQQWGMGAGGGGGAGGAGSAGTFSSPATGGVGSSAYSSWGAATGTGQNVSGTYYYAGGGGGYANYGGGSGTSPGGYGGGGIGNPNSGTPVPGTANTGGGAGASQGIGAAGGSGIVIVRYAMA